MRRLLLVLVTLTGLAVVLAWLRDLRRTGADDRGLRVLVGFADGASVVLQSERERRPFVDAATEVLVR
jgi:hypothetical protein